jgi:hypothetical protein
MFSSNLITRPQHRRLSRDGGKWQSSLEENSRKHAATKQSGDVAKKEGGAVGKAPVNKPTVWGKLPACFGA